MCIENTTLNTVHTQIPYNMDWGDLIWYATAYFRLIESFGSCIIELSNLICIFFCFNFLLVIGIDYNLFIDLLIVHTFHMLFFSSH